MYKTNSSNGWMWCLIFTKMFTVTKASLYNNRRGSAEDSNRSSKEKWNSGTRKRSHFSTPRPQPCGLWGRIMVCDKSDPLSKLFPLLLESLFSPQKIKEVKICEWIDWSKMPPGLKCNPQKTRQLWTSELPKIVQSMNRDWTDQCVAERRRRVTSQHLLSYTNPPPAERISTLSPSIVTQRESHTLKLTGLVEQTGISWHS